MDTTWAADQLNEFAELIDQLTELEINSRVNTAEERDGYDNEVRRREPVMRRIENAIEAGLGDYSADYDEWKTRWWNARNAALTAAGICQYGAEAARARGGVAAAAGAPADADAVADEPVAFGGRAACRGGRAAKLRWVSGRDLDGELSLNRVRQRWTEDGRL